ncbi:MAG TPA: M48 family metallopeptidase [Steroidobacteraceae bacterium]|nr:M48 family metallopeptidase [Steroidobacteraceae bacterium]
MSHHRILPFLAALLLLAGSAAAPALEPPAGVASGAPAAAATAAPAAFSADAATERYLATLSAAARARSDAYFEGGYWLTLWNAVISLAVAWLVLGSRLSVRLRDLAERLTGRRWLQPAIYALAYILLVTLITLPWDAYQGFFREHQYGMSNQTFPAWLGDEAKGLAIGLVFGALAALAIYAVIRRAAQSWWLWGALVALALVVLQIVIGPTYLEPVFNRFYPLPDSPLKAEILSLARANSIPVSQVYEFDASRQTTKMSAHVSGLFGTAQISLNDNLMNRASPEEVKAVLGHEMGHYVLNHVYKGVTFFAIVIVLGFAFLHAAVSRVLAGVGRDWGVRDAADPAGMPLLLALFGLFFFVMTPVLNTITRAMEAEADAFGLNASREPDGFAQAALHLSEYRKMRPGPVEEFLFFDHPSGWNRIHRAMVWKAENLAAADIAAYDARHPAPGTAPP